MYLEGLIGPDTVNTLPQATLEAFRDHGVAAPTLDRDADSSLAVIKQLDSVGIDFDAVTAQLQTEGVDLFAQSFDKTRETIAKAIGEPVTTRS
jgi:transaldolase